MLLKKYGLGALVLTKQVRRLICIQPVVNVFLRITLLILLFCSQGRSMCVDDFGKSYFCQPQFLTHGDDHDKSCPCPCNDDDCEEHEIRLDPVVTDSIKIPSESCIILPATFAVLFDPNASVFLVDQPNKRLPAIDDPNPALRLRKALMAGVVLRL